MEIKTKLQDGTFMEVRIKNGLINEVLYKGNIEEKLLSRKDSEHIKSWLKDILKANVTNFKEILSNIQEDEEFFSYGKALLACEREKKLEILLGIRKEYSRRMKQAEEVIKEYDWP